MFVYDDVIFRGVCMGMSDDDGLMTGVYGCIEKPNFVMTSLKYDP